MPANEILPVKCLLVMENAPAHLPGLEDELMEEFSFISVKFLPPSTTPLIQLMDQQVISNFKKLYTKALFQRCFDVTSDTELTIREFWKSHFRYPTLLTSHRQSMEGCVSQNNEVSMEEIVARRCP
ncbi:hypothetical protein mRhiFer1_009745 [Rhinolophus ferrumequinum]|uniref:DDE-1 domain-containing protein n=1 Tax=Rhinolophus ferrumequinum TaxID=59479 RepID=A0A7J7ZDH8_RHIFE|nr:hypothetical protein mRhiFer1_009745 [Rhinolophus ferrumequinum]